MNSAGILQARPLLLVAFLGVSVTALPDGLHGQTTGEVTGVVTDAAGAPVFGAVVEVAGSSVSSRTNERGEFRITGIPAGTADIFFRRLGFAPVTSTASISQNQPASLAVVLPSLPVVVQPVIVEGSRVEYKGRLAGYYERLQRRSNGTFISRELIDRRSSKTLSQLLAATPGVSSLRLRTGGAVRMRGRSCRPLVWMDGVPLPAGEVDLDAFPVNTLHGIEIYLGSTTAPLAYTASQGRSSCGTILLWSRGRDTEHSAPPRRSGIDLEELAASQSVYTPDAVDSRAELVQQPFEVGYPPALFAQGISGSAIAEFVVDVTGKIAPETFGIFFATHPLFAEAVTQALADARFRPAVKGGKPVRQFVQQPFTFTPGVARSTVGLKN